MSLTANNSFFRNAPQHLRRMYAWRRLKIVGGFCAFWILLFTLTWQVAYWILVVRWLFIGFSCLTVFGIFEVWPRRLPRFIARWALQVFAVAVIVPIAVVLGYQLTTIGLNPPWWKDDQRLEGVFTFIFIAMLFGPWIAVAALLNQIKEQAQKQAMQFQLERSELARDALNAQLNLLQAQVQPHFLFNTLANVRELVVIGSPRAAMVLENLIAYLRASVPQISNEVGTLADEIERTRAYLEIMHMRMPDRLQFSFDVSPEATLLPCPPMSLLTMVENAVRHGIDPSEGGGRIDVAVHLYAGCVEVEVRDTGVGLQYSRQNNHLHEITPGLGSGIRNLQARLRMVFDESASVTLVDNQPHGTVAVMRWKA